MEHPRVLLHTCRIPIRWGDMDAMGHVNNTIYFRYMEQARISWFEAIGARSGVKGQGPVIVNASCTFIKQLVYPGDVEIKTFIGELGRSSVQTYLELRPSYDPERIYAEGAAKVVWVDYAREKSVPLPDSIRNLIGQ